jgi:hypothetical protein
MASYLNPYTDDHYGPALSATSGFLHGYRQYMNEAAMNQYRRSVSELTRSQSALTKKKLELAEENPELLFGRTNVTVKPFAPLDVNRIYGTMEEFEDFEQFSNVWNPESDPDKQQQLQNLWQVREQQKPGFWSKVGAGIRQLAKPPLFSVGEGVQRLRKHFGQKALDFPATAQKPVVSPDRVRVRDAQGNEFMLPVSQLEEARQQGYMPVE